MYRDKKGRFISYERVFMKRFITGTMIIFPWAFAVAQYQALAQPIVYQKQWDTHVEQKVEEKKDTVKDYKEYARTKAKENGVSVRWVMYLISCETAGTWDPTIQSYVTQKYGREKSYGLAQIHLPDNKDITYDQATDPYFAIDFIINETLKGNYKWRWRNCYKSYRQKYPL